MGKQEIEKRVCSVRNELFLSRGQLACLLLFDTIGDSLSELGDEREEFLAVQDTVTERNNVFFRRFI